VAAIIVFILVAGGFAVAFVLRRGRAAA